jgi:hypothetical protein
MQFLSFFSMLYHFSRYIYQKFAITAFSRQFPRSLGVAAALARLYRL